MDNYWPNQAAQERRARQRAERKLHLIQMALDAHGRDVPGSERIIHVIDRILKEG